MNKKLLSNLTIGTIASVGVLTASVAQAQPVDINATFGANLFIESFQPPGDISNATDITLAANSFTINSLPEFYGGISNDFDETGMTPLALGGTGTLSTTSLDIDGFTPIPAYLTWQSADDSKTFTYDLNALEKLPSTPGFLNLFGTGIFKQTGGTPMYNDSEASFRLTFTEATGGGAIIGGFVWASPPEQIDVPEPSTMLGLAVISGLGFLAKRQKS
jgi:hypothetical protein